MFNGYNMMESWGVSWLNTINPLTLWSIFALLSLWTIIWKGMALWRAARNNHLPWFIALLVINTVGILEIIYIVFFSKEKTAAKK